MKIEKIAQSKLVDIDLNLLEFGETFTDHMLVCDYRDGKWEEVIIQPYGPISIMPSMKCIHYGQSIFEGMKVFKDAEGEMFLYRPEKNWIRLNESAHRMAMPSLPKDIFMDGLMALLKLDQDWIPTTEGASMYIRPFMFGSESAIRASPSTEYKFMIILSPVNTYYSQPLKVKIAQNFSRSSVGGVGFAKVAGNYAASFLPTEEAEAEGFDQIIWTDANKHSELEEASTMNIFVRINDILYTPPLSERILHGITRDSVLKIAKQKKIEVIEKSISVAELEAAHKDGSLKEMFGCGTAVVINQFKTIGYPDATLDLAILPFEESYALQIKKTLQDIQYNRAEDPFNWRVKVS